MSFAIFLRNFELLDIIEFSSSRKRMSVIVKNEEGTLLLLCKGADRFVGKIYRGYSIMSHDKMSY